MSKPFRIINDMDEGTLVRDVIQSRVTVRLTRETSYGPGMFVIEATESDYPPHFLVTTDTVDHTVRLLANLINRVMLADMGEDALLDLDFAKHQLTTYEQASRMVDQCLHPSGAREATFTGAQA